MTHKKLLNYYQVEPEYCTIEDHNILCKYGIYSCPKCGESTKMISTITVSVTAPEDVYWFMDSKILS